MPTLQHRLLAGAAAAAIAGGVIGTAHTASAEPIAQDGLVNVNLSDVTVQVPVALAANVCDVNVAVLVNDLLDGSAPCTASASPDATVTPTPGGPVSQDGLVNVNVSDLVVQVPVSVAADVCDIDVAVLTSRLVDSASPCDATGTANAITTITS